MSPPTPHIHDTEIDSAMTAVSNPDAPYDPAALTLAAAVRQLRAELHAARTALADCVVKAAELGDLDGGFVAMYVLPTGPIHRAIPLLQNAGITVRPGFDGRTGGDPAAIVTTGTLTTTPPLWGSPTTGGETP